VNTENRPAGNGQKQKTPHSLKRMRGLSISAQKPPSSEITQRNLHKIVIHVLQPDRLVSTNMSFITSPVTIARRQASALTYDSDGSEFQALQLDL